MQIRFVAAILIAFLAGQGARAATIIRTFDIRAANFRLLAGPDTPSAIQRVHLNFTVSFDPAIDTSTTTAGLTINAFNLPYTTEFAYSVFEQTMTVATSAAIGSCGAMPGSYCMFMKSVGSGTPIGLSFVQVTSSGGFWAAGSIAAEPGPIPEPAAWAMMLTGFAGLGTILRKRRAAAAVV